ncbi:MAG: hypothetical protein ACK4RS_04320 [Thiothrix sp.]
MIQEQDWRQWQTQSPAHAATAAFLLFDVQNNLHMLETLQSALAALQANLATETYSLSGNSYFVQLQPQQVVIEELYGENTAEPLTLSLEDFNEALTYWQTRQRQ